MFEWIKRFIGKDNDLVTLVRWTIVLYLLLMSCMVSGFLVIRFFDWIF